MENGYGLLDQSQAEEPGDEWEEIDVSDTEADQIARKRDREFNEFRKRIKDADQFKVAESVFDEATFAALYRLVQGGIIDAFGGPVSTGKEANVYTARAGKHAQEKLETDDTEIAVKIYRISASDFTDMRDYLVGDPRFEELGDKKRIVLAWTRKEFANLKRARKAGVRVPQPLAVERNVLAMEFIGKGTSRAKRLDEVNVENPQTAYEVVREYIRRLYDAGLVHGDLSEYNLLFHRGQIVVIDVGQAVTIHHPNAEEFLKRDCENIASFFSRQGYSVTGNELVSYIREHADPYP